jgi:hypothetical protein
MSHMAQQVHCRQCRKQHKCSNRITVELCAHFARVSFSWARQTFNDPALITRIGRTYSRYLYLFDPLELLECFLLATFAYKLLFEPQHWINRGEFLSQYRFEIKKGWQTYVNNFVFTSNMYLNLFFYIIAINNIFHYFVSVFGVPSS